MAPTTCAGLARFALRQRFADADDRRQAGGQPACAFCATSSLLSR
jgi:hypothetical protein